MAKQDDYVRYTIRVPAEIYEWVQTEADKSGRSVNAEIVAILSAAIEKEKYKNSLFSRPRTKTLGDLGQKAPPLNEFEEVDALLERARAVIQQYSKASR